MSSTDCVGVKVLEELDLTVAVRCLEHGNFGVVTIETYGGIGPLTADSVPADKLEAQVSEERDRRVDVADSNPDVF